VVGANVLLATGAPTADSRLQVLGAIAAPAALLVFAHNQGARVVALIAGCAIGFFGIDRRLEFGIDGEQWLSIAFAAASGWTVFGILVSGLRRDLASRNVATALLGLLGVLWLCAALASISGQTGAAGIAVVWNLRFASSLVLLAAFGTAWRLLPRDSEFERVVLAATMLVVTYVTGLLEVLSAVEGVESGWSRVASSLYTLVFACALLVGGFVWRQVTVRWIGLAGLALVAVKVVLFDLANLATPLRILAAGAVGVVMLLVAYGYAKGRKAPE
jgi:hypothetical protein